MPTAAVIQSPRTGPGQTPRCSVSSLLTGSCRSRVSPDGRSVLWLLTCSLVALLQATFLGLPVTLWWYDFSGVPEWCFTGGATSQLLSFPAPSLVHIRECGARSPLLPPSTGPPVQLWAPASAPRRRTPRTGCWRAGLRGQGRVHIPPRPLVRANFSLSQLLFLPEGT